MAAPKIPQVDWAEIVPTSVVLISGPEEFFADRASARIRELLRERFTDLEVHDIDAATYGAGEIFTVASPSLFAEPRLIRVTGVEKCSDAFIDDVKKYVAEPADDTTLVLRHSGGQRGKALLDAVRRMTAGAVEVPCPELKKEQERVTFVQSEFRRLGARATPGAVRLLTAAFATGSVAELAGVCAQLVNDSGKEVTEETVNRITEGRIEASGFKVADMAIAGKRADALVLLRQAMLAGTSPIPILAAINMKLRGMARVYRAHGSTGELAKRFGMAPWMVDRAMRDTRGWHETDLARTINLAAETEWELKGGSRDPEFAIERFVSLVASRGRE